MKIECFRCGEELDSPDESNAHYVRGEDTIVELEEPYFVEIRHTDETRAIRDDVKEYHDMTMTMANNVVARNDGEYLRDEALDYDVTEGDFEVVEDNDPDLPGENPEVVRVEERSRTTEVKQPQIICKDCYERTDFCPWCQG